MTSPTPPFTARAIAAAVRAGEQSARSVVEQALQRIRERDPQVAAFVEVWESPALARADALDAARTRGDSLGPLAGVPVAVKDNFARTGQAMTCGSRILEGFVSPYSATVLDRLEAAGAVLIGRTNMDEFAMGSSTEHSCHGATRNPFDLNRSPGGSSGGSAAAVAARMVPLALGSDTGGSVRQPAALCGVSGLKPTYGRVSRFGMVAFASSLDTVSPFAVDAEDLALCLKVIAGEDPKDSTCLHQPVPDYATEGASLEGLRVGVPVEYFGEGVDPEIAACVRAAVASMADHGATTVDVTLPHTKYAIPTYYLIATAEASSNLARYDGVRYGHRGDDSGSIDAMYTATRTEGFGAEVQRRILLGSYCLCRGYVDAWYLKAQKVRTLIRQDFDAAFAKADILVGPTSPVPAFALGEKLEDPLAMYMNDILTTPANLAGVPGLSIPCGANADGLPIGLQLMAPPLGEPRLLRAAAAFQAVTDHHHREPELQA